MKLKTYKKKFKDLYSHSIEEVEMLLARYGFEYIKNATEFVYMNGGVNRIQKLIDENTPETLQDVINDIGKNCIDYWGCTDYGCEECPKKINDKTPDDYYKTDGDCRLAMYRDISRRLKAIAECMGGDGESKADEPVEIPEQKTCPHCGSSHVIVTKVITIGEGKRSEEETDFCLTCGRDLVGGSNE